MEQTQFDLLKRSLNVFEQLATGALAAGYFKNLKDTTVVTVALEDFKRILNENDPGNNLGSKGNSPAIHKRMGHGNHEKKARKEKTGERKPAAGANGIAERVQPELPIQ